MTKMLAKWLNQRYLLLSERLGTEPFGFTEAEKILKRNFSDSTQMVSLVLSMLKNAGWLNVAIDPKDSRKRIYSLVMLYRDNILKELVAETKAEIKGENHE